MITILAFAAVILLLVMVHEWGHFYAARKTGMDVEEFAFGFPPRVASYKKKGTRYSFNLLPLGGYVKIKGENGDSDEPGSFSSKSIPKRLIVLAAGVIMNIVLAWALLTGALALGTPQALGVDQEANGAVNQRVMISWVAPGSPAESAGIQPGDVVVRINDEPVASVTDVQEKTAAASGQESTYVISREGETLNVAITPRVNPPAGEGALGVQLVSVADVSYPLHQAVWKGAVYTWEYTKLTVVAFAQIIGQIFSSAPVSGDVAGPVGIAVMSGKFAKMGLAAFMQFTAILSINLAIINALPIPALDGGRIAFTLVEAVRRKKVHVKIEQYSHAIGFALLLALMIFITIRDVLNHI